MKTRKPEGQAALIHREYDERISAATRRMYQVLRRVEKERREAHDEVESLERERDRKIRGVLGFS